MTLFPTLSGPAIAHNQDLGDVTILVSPHSLKFDEWGGVIPFTPVRLLCLEVQIFSPKEKTLAWYFGETFIEQAFRKHLLCQI